MTTIDSTTILAAAAALLTTIALLVSMFALSIIRRDKGVDDRLNTYLGSDGNTMAMAENHPQLSERINEAINRQSFAEQVARDLEQANLKLTVSEYLLIRCALPLVLALAGLLIWRMGLMALISGAVGAVLPVFWLRRRRKRRNREFNDQLAETLSMLVSSLRGGFSLLQSLVAVSKEAQEPTSTELRRVCQEVQLGVSLAQALDHLVKRVESDDLDLVVTAIKINTRVGGNLTNILDNISTTIRERAKLRREVYVITSMQRMSSYVIGFMPVGLAGVIFAINPPYILRLFQPGWTLCIPFGAIVFSMLGFFAIQRIVDIKV